MVFENRLQSYCKCTKKTKFQKHKKLITNFSTSILRHIPNPLLFYTCAHITSERLDVYKR